MKFFNQILHSQKPSSEFDIDKVRKELKEKGVQVTEERLSELMDEYKQMLEFDRRNKIFNVSFVTTIVALLFLALELHLRNINVLSFSATSHVLFTIMGFAMIGFSWLMYYFQINKYDKLYCGTFIFALIVEISLIIAILFIR